MQLKAILFYTVPAKVVANQKLFYEALTIDPAAVAAVHYKTDNPFSKVEITTSRAEVCTGNWCCDIQPADVSGNVYFMTCAAKTSGDKPTAQLFNLV